MQRFWIDRRDVRAHDLPAFRKANPHLGLAADLVGAADLVLEIHGRDIAAEREDLEPAPRLLRARARRTPHAMGGDLGKAVAVLDRRVADRMRTPPERRVEDLDVLIHESLFVALEQLAHFGDDFGNVGRKIGYRALL